MPGEQSFGRLLADIVRDLQLLMSSEISLAKAEIGANIAEFRSNIGIVAGFGLLAFSGLIILLQGIALALAIWIPAWAAFLGVGLTICLVAALVVKTAVGRLAARQLKPVTSVKSVKKDIQTIEEHI